MATFSEQYLAALVANAAYVDFSGLNPTTSTPLSDLLLIDKLRRERFSQKEAEAFEKKFEVVAVYSDGLTSGFQGIALRERALADGEPAGFGRTPGRIWVAFRGTEEGLGAVLDMRANLQLILSRARVQRASLKDFIESLETSVASGGYGLLTGSTKVNFAGHSLGGHLAQLATMEYPQYLYHTYTFNTANVGGLLTGLLGIVGVPLASAAARSARMSRTPCHRPSDIHRPCADSALVQPIGQRSADAANRCVDGQCPHHELVHHHGQPDRFRGNCRWRCHDRCENQCTDCGWGVRVPERRRHASAARDDG